MKNLSPGRHPLVPIMHIFNVNDLKIAKEHYKRCVDRVNKIKGCTENRATL